MDVKYDSALESIEEAELVGDGTIRPYMFEPERNSVAKNGSDFSDSGTLIMANRLVQAMIL